MQERVARERRQAAEAAEEAERRRVSGTAIALASEKSGNSLRKAQSGARNKWLPVTRESSTQSRCDLWMIVPSLCSLQKITERHGLSIERQTKTFACHTGARASQERASHVDGDHGGAGHRGEHARPRWSVYWQVRRRTSLGERGGDSVYHASVKRKRGNLRCHASFKKEQR